METPKLRQVQYDLFDTAKFFSILADIGLNERDFRLVVAAVAEAESTWNMSYIAECANVSRTTIYSGLADLRGEALGNKANGEKRQRASGGGRKDILEKDPSIREDIRTIIEPHVRGSPETPLRWISKSWAKISAALRNAGHRVCANTVGKVLHTRRRRNRPRLVAQLVECRLATSRKLGLQPLLNHLRRQTLLHPALRTVGFEVLKHSPRMGPSLVPRSVSRERKRQNLQLTSGRIQPYSM